MSSAAFTSDRHAMYNSCYTLLTIHMTLMLEVTVCFVSAHFVCSGAHFTNKRFCLNGHTKNNNMCTGEKACLINHLQTNAGV